MTDETAPLPDDVEQLKGLVIAQRVEIEHLKLLIAKLKRMQFGRSSEKFDREIAQLELKLEDLEITQDKMLARVRVAKPESATPKRQPLPEHLPRESRVHQPPCQCPDCGGAMRRIGEDVSEMLEHVPEQFKVIRIVRPKLACERCERIVQAPAPSRPIVRGVAGPGLLAHILVSKYCDHLPLYRQSQIYARQGIELERSTMAEWVGQVFQLVDPLIEALGRSVLGAKKLHADDTPIPVLDPDRGRTKTGRLWTYVRDDRPAGSTDPPAVLFRYSPDRRGEHPQGHLKDFTGILQADAYSGFNGLYERGRIVEAACWAHYLERRFIQSYLLSVPLLTTGESAAATRHNSNGRAEGSRHFESRHCRSRCVASRVSRRTSPGVSGALPAWLHALYTPRAVAPSPGMAAIRA